MVIGKFKFVVLILILVFGINMISARSFAADTKGNIITTSDGYSFNTETGVITDYSGNGGNIEIPSQINGIKVIGIGNSAFYYCDGLTAVTIPSSVSSIGSGVFVYCRNLSAINVNAANANYSSSNGVFFNKTQTTLLRYPERITATSYNIPNTVANISYGAFENCFSLTNITIPNSVTSINNCAFSGCTSLKNITFPGVTYLGDSLFYDCHLESVTIPKTLKSYYYDAGGSGDGSPLAFCTIDNVIFEDGITAIEDDVMAYCDYKSVTIPSSVTSIDQDIYEYNHNLTIITYPGTYADKFAQSNNMLVKYILATSVPTVPNPVPEDINSDRAVNMKDVILAASHFNTTSSGSDYDIKCDLNDDGCINLIDIMRIAAKFNYTY